MNLYLIGGGGHCISCIDTIEAEGKYNISGIFDNNIPAGSSVLNYKVLGTDDIISNFINKDSHFLITVGQIQNNNIRIKLYNLLKDFGANIATVISPRSYVSKHTTIDEGTIILHDVLINANATIGANCIINTKCLIEHDVRILNHCHISTASVINGNVNVGNNCFIGSNSTIRQNIKISDNTFIQAGSFYNGK